MVVSPVDFPNKVIEVILEVNRRFPSDLQSKTFTTSRIEHDLRHPESKWSGSDQPLAGLGRSESRFRVGAIGAMSIRVLRLPCTNNPN